MKPEIKVQERTCETCPHKAKTYDTCRHPQADHDWGRLVGMQTTLPDKGWPRYPKASGWCGFWSPTKAWLDSVKA